MPKRVIDFDAMWGSDKLAACAGWAQAEYAWLYGLADASGCFEITNLRVIWGRVAAIRSNLTIERLEQVFAEFQDKGLLFVWEHEGKRYAHWTGSDVPGRLPPPSWRMRLEKFAPPVPKRELAAYVAKFARGRGAFGAAGFRGEGVREDGPAGCASGRVAAPARDERGLGEPSGRGRQENLRFETAGLREGAARVDYANGARVAASAGNQRACCEGERGGACGLEEAQGQDLGLDSSLDLNRKGNGTGELEAGADEARLERSSNRAQSAELNSFSSGSERTSGPDAQSFAERLLVREPLPPPLPPLDIRGMTAREIAVAKELRVGQGPVCNPAFVRPEVLERARLRDLARAKTRSP